MLSEDDYEDSDSENLPEVDLLDQLSKLTIGSDVDIDSDETVSKASSKVLLRSNPVFEESRISSKVTYTFCLTVTVDLRIFS